MAADDHRAPTDAGTGTASTAPSASSASDGGLDFGPAQRWSAARRAVKWPLRHAWTLSLVALPVVLLALPGTLPGETLPARAQSQDGRQEDEEWRASGTDELD